MSVPTVFMVLPHYSRMVDVAVAQKFFTATSTKAALWPELQRSSLLAHGFNLAFKRAQDDGHDWFLMLHADLEPVNADWIDVLLSEAERVEADVMAAVVPIKDRRGLTSTALGVLDNPWKRQRLLMQQIANFPETFCSADIGQGERPLLVNTGCMLVNLRRPWVSEAHFEIRNRIDGDSVECEPEDWFFSRRAWELGAKVYATTKVRTRHYGDTYYPSWIRGADDA